MNRLRSGWMLIAPALGASGLISQYVSSVELVFWLMMIGAGLYFIFGALRPVLEDRTNARMAARLRREGFIRGKPE